MQPFRISRIIRIIRISRISRIGALVLAFSASSISAQTTASTSPAEILESTIEALGGRAFINVKDIQTSGRFYSFVKGELAASDLFVDYVRFPDMQRTEFGKERQKKVLINRGKEGWTVSPPVKGKDVVVEPQALRDREDFAENFKTSFDYMMRFVVKEPKTILIYAGTEVVEQRRVHVVEIRDANKNLMRLYIDRETRLPARMQMRRAGTAVVHEENYSNWHRFDSVMTPLFVVRYRDGVKTMEIRAEKASYDTGLPDSLFAPPAPESK